VNVLVIVPVLNEAAVLDMTLSAVARQDRDHETIVVDGGSTDETVAIATRYARVISAPTGRASQMNAGGRGARADVLIFVHADTILPSGAIAAVEEALEDPGVVGGRFRVRLDQRGWRYRIVEASINLRDLLVSGFTGDQAIFVRRTVFESLGGYRDMELMEDLDFGRRMARCGKVVRLPLAVVTSARRWQRNGVVRTVLLMWSLKILWACGMQPSRLKRLYGDAR